MENTAEKRSILCKNKIFQLKFHLTCNWQSKTSDFNLPLTAFIQTFLCNFFNMRIKKEKIPEILTSAAFEILFLIDSPLLTQNQSIY